MPTHRSPSEPTPEPAAVPAPLARREMIGLTLGLAALAALGGCATSTSTAGRSRVGDPIPDSPRYQRLPSTPRQSPRVMPPRQTPAAPPRVAVIDRSAWARFGPDTRNANRMGRISAITVHHDGMSPFHSNAQHDAAERLESIRRSHVGSRHWADIGYHYAIDPAGRVWAARPEELQGAHVRHQNGGNLGVLVMGNYERQHPTEATMRALDTFIAEKMTEHRVSIDRVFTHRELARTACPGRHLQSHMLAARTGRGSIIATLNAGNGLMG